MWRSLRLYIILIISLLGLILTQFWYQNSKLDFATDRKEPVAYIYEKRNDVEQKLYDHLIWKSVAVKQRVYLGDTIRTSKNSQTDIVFIKSGTAISLNEQTQIVIDERKGETTINLLKGSVLAKGNGKAPVVVAGESKVYLEKEKNEIKISVAEDKKVSGCVYSGGMIVESNQGSRKKVGSGNCTDRNLIVTTFPQQNSVVTRVGKSSPTKFQFVGHEGSYDADLYLGKSQDHLEKVASAKSTSTKGLIEANAPDGLFYWKVVTHDGEKEIGHSAVAQTEMQTIEPPAPITPIRNGDLKTDEEKMDVPFSWAHSPLVKEYKIEVSKSEDFSKEKVFEHKSDRSDVRVPLVRNQSYYWRVTAFWKDSQYPPSVSEIRKFSIDKIVKLKTPTLLSPEEGETFHEKDLETLGHLFSWTSVPDADFYSVKLIANGNDRRFDSKETNLRIKNLKHGHYVWSVQARNLRDSSDFSATRSFVVLEALNIHWVKPIVKQMEVGGDSPVLDLEWTPTAEVVQWKVFYENPETKFKSHVVVTNYKTQLKVPTVGKWKLQLVGYDAKGNVREASVQNTVFIKTPEILPSPEVEGAVNLTLKGLPDGSLDVRWKPVGGAQSYLLYLKDAGGKETKFETTDTHYTFHKLNGGFYGLRLVSKNLSGRIGTSSQPYKIKVPATSSPPPVIKNIIIK